MQPLLLGKLVSYYASSESVDDETAGYLYALGVILISAVSVFFFHPNNMGIQHMGMKIRVAICSLIYRKTLRLSKAATGQTTSGQVVNLMTNDVGRLDTSMLHIHYLWIGPVAVAIITYLMYLEVRKYSCNILEITISSIPFTDWYCCSFWCYLNVIVHTHSGIFGQTNL